MALNRFNSVIKRDCENSRKLKDSVERCYSSHTVTDGTDIVESKMLLGFMTQFNLQEIVNSPTRFTCNTATNIDVIATNRIDCFETPVTYPFGASDHHLISAQFHARGLKPWKPHKVIQYRDYSKLDVQRIASVLTKEEWNKVVGFDDVLPCVECLGLTISGILDVVIPIKSKRVKSNVPPWSLTPKARNARFRCDKAHKTALRIGTPESWVVYRKLRIRPPQC